MGILQNLRFFPRLLIGGAHGTRHQPAGHDGFGGNFIPDVGLPFEAGGVHPQARTTTSMRNWSPGTTGRRKRARSMPVKTISNSSRLGTSVSSKAPPACAIASTIRTPGMIGL